MKNVLSDNIANMLTLFRLLMSGVYLLLVKTLIENGFTLERFIFVFICVGLIWLSDFFDGRIARYLNIDSTFGQYFDVIADFVYVFFTHLQITIYGIIPEWFLIVIMERITNYIVTSFLYHRNAKYKGFFVKDPVGMYVASAFFVTPFCICMLQEFGRSGEIIIDFILGVLTICSVFSTVFRLCKLVKRSWYKEIM